MYFRPKDRAASFEDVLAAKVLGESDFGSTQKHASFGSRFFFKTDLI
jgi:hypothetical protein